jgi:hypothetical protein
MGPRPGAHGTAFFLKAYSFFIRKITYLVFSPHFRLCSLPPAERKAIFFLSKLLFLRKGVMPYIILGA